VGPLSDSSVINSTFRNIQSINLNARGGIFNFDNINASEFIIDRCIFAESKGGDRGGAIYIYGYMPFIYISRCRFENNNYREGLDIRIVLRDEGGNENALTSSIDTFTCSTSTPSNQRVNYDGQYRNNILQNNCTDDIV
jgi:hypothetical protein